MGDDADGLVNQILLAASIRDGLAACGKACCAEFEKAQATWESAMREIGRRGMRLVDDGRGRPRLERGNRND